VSASVALSLPFPLQEVKTLTIAIINSILFITVYLLLG
jgi:hypothetical protein